VKGKHNAAVLYSLIATAKRHGLDPFAYPRDVIARISDHPTNKLHELLPDHWKLAAYYSAGVFARPTGLSSPRPLSIEISMVSPDIADRSDLTSEPSPGLRSNRFGRHFLAGSSFRDAQAIHGSGVRCPALSIMPCFPLHDTHAHPRTNDSAASN